MKKLTKAEEKTLATLLARADANGQVPAKHKLQVHFPEQVDQVKSILNQRGERYGDFTDHASLAQSLQRTLHRFAIPIKSEDRIDYRIPWDELTPVARQALTVIMDKIARILSGNQFYDDNWIDIQGYARLVQERLPQSGTSPE